MDGLGFAVGLGVLVATSVHAGRYWAHSTVQATLLGVAASVAADVAAAATSVVVLAWHSSAIDAGVVGTKLIILVAAGPFVGAAVTVWTLRRTLRDASRSAKVVGARLRALEGGRP